MRRGEYMRRGLIARPHQVLSISVRRTLFNPTVRPFLAYLVRLFGPRGSRE